MGVNVQPSNGLEFYRQLLKKVTFYSQPVKNTELRPSIKPGTRNIPEHPGTFRNNFSVLKSTDSHKIGQRGQKP